MCDYSLGELASRLACEGEVLVVHRFKTGSMGMASPANLAKIKVWRPPQGLWGTLEKILSPRPCEEAVCLPPGSRLALTNIPTDIQDAFGIRETEEVIFDQRSVEAYQHRDGFRFKSTGQFVLLQRLPEGIMAEVVWMQSTEEDLTDQAAVLTATH